MRILCVIPVRGGSKGLPRKNALEIVDGVSLLEWTSGQARDCYPAEDIFVSTEDNELARIAENCHVQVVKRPIELARDSSTTTAVVEHLLSMIDPEATRFDAVAILQVTSPLREPDDILRSIDMMNSGAYDSVVSAYATTVCNPAKLYFLEETMEVPLARPVAPEHEFARRQDLPQSYRRNGAIYIVTRDHFARTGRLWGGRTGLVVMPEKRSVDIDTAADLNKVREVLSYPNAGSGP